MRCLLIAMMCALLLAGCGGETTGATKTVRVTDTKPVQIQVSTVTVTSTPELPPGPKTTFDDGTYIVGTDILPGTYRAPGPAAGDSCYWERMGSLGGGDIIANERAPGAQIVTIAPSDAGFKTEECGTWIPAG